MDTALRVAKENTRREMLQGGKELALKALGSPLLQLLLFCALVEVAQTIPLGNKDSEGHDRYLISETLGNSLQLLAGTQTTLSTVAGSLETLSPLLALIK